MNHKKFHSDGFHKAEGSAHLNAGGHGSGGHGFGGGGYYGSRSYYGYGYPVGYGYGYPYLFVDTPPNAEELADNQKPVAINQLNNTDAPLTPAPVQPMDTVMVAPKNVASGVGGDVQPARTGIKTETVTLLVGAALCSIAFYVLLRTKKMI